MTRWMSVLLIWIISVASPPLAAGQTPVTARGQAALGPNTTLDEARRLAIRRAEARAIGETCGVAIQGETFVRNGLLSADFLRASTYGLIVGKPRIIKQKTDSFQKTPASPVVLQYVVRLEAAVRCEKSLPGPSYTLRVSLNRTTFRSGENLVLRVLASKDSYLTVLSLGADGKVYVVRPNFIERKSFIPGGREVALPSARERGAGLSYEVSVVAGHKRDRESLLLVATRRPIFITPLEKKEGLESFETPQLAMNSVARWLARIPIAERTGTAADYVVHAR